MMNRARGELGPRRHALRSPRRAGRAGHVSSARDMTTLARILMQKPAAARIVAMRDATIAGGRRLHTWNDLLGRLSRASIGVKTGHTDRAGWSQVAAVRGPGVTVYATHDRQPGPFERNGDLVELMAWGLSRFRVVSGDLGAAAPTREPRLRTTASRWRSWRRARCGEPSLSATARGARRGSRERRASGDARARSWERCRVYDRGARSSRLAARRLAFGRRAGHARARRLVRRARGATTCGAGWHELDDHHRHSQRSARPDADRPELPARPAAPGERGGSRSPAGRASTSPAR